MRFSDIYETLETLDRAYETIDGEHRTASGGVAPASWESIVRGRPRRVPGIATGDLLCAQHGGAPHGLSYDPLTDHLSSELSEWIRIAQWSPTAQSILGIERIEPGPGSRVASMVYLDDDLELQTRFAATGRSVVPTEGGRWLWAQEPQELVGFRQRASHDEPYLMFSNELNKARRFSFADVRKGYEEYLKSAGRRADEAAWSRLRTCSTPKLLGMLTDYNVRNTAERVPLAMSEAFLWDGDGELAGELAAPCETCRFGLSAWMCGHADMLKRATSGYVLDYAAEAAELTERLRSRKEPERRARPAEEALAAAPTGIVDGEITVKTPRASLRGRDLLASGVGAAPVSSRAAVAGAAPIAPTAAAIAGAAPSGAVGGASAAVAGSSAPVTGSSAAPSAVGTAKGAIGATGGSSGDVGPTAMLDLPERDVTGADRRRARGPAEEDSPARVAFSTQARRDRVRVRMEASGFSCEDVEIRELRGKEAISQLFSFHLEIVCFDESGLDVAKMVGSDASLVFEQGSLEVRRVHGMIAEVTDLLETESSWRSYRLWIVPRVWRSTLVETQEVYLETSVPDLIQQKLSLVGLSGSDVEMRLLGNYPVRELIVQYKETDVAFISRLAEHLGICFFFEHDGGTDKIVFSDSGSGFRQLSDAAMLPFRPRGERVDVFELSARTRAFPASFAMQDYNYRTPLVDLTSVFEAPAGFGGGVVEYGAHYKTPADGAALAKVRAEERHVANEDFTGKSDVAQITAGGRFQLVGHARMEGVELLVTEVEHHVRQTVKMMGAGGSDEAYSNTFRAVSAELPYRPPRVTPRPRIQGVLTALVEPNPGGEIGESAQIDAEGRYTVKFYFDAGDVSGRPKNSRPVRMVQPHAGPNYGVHFPLKPGIEVLIVFVDGDPDRPLIIGSVPNPVTPSPVVQEVNLMNRIETASGLIIEMRDAVPPLAK